MPDELSCAVCMMPVAAASTRAGGVVCALCTERLIDRWAETNHGLTIQEWLARNNLSASCMFWHANPNAAVKATRCDDCAGTLARHCNQPLLGKDPHNIIPGRCGAFESCCDGNLVVDKRGLQDGTHSRCHTFRRREIFRTASRLRILTD